MWAPQLDTLSPHVCVLSVFSGPAEYADGVRSVRPTQPEAEWAAARHLPARRLPDQPVPAARAKPLQPGQRPAVCGHVPQLAAQCLWHVGAVNDTHTKGFVIRHLTRALWRRSGRTGKIRTLSFKTGIISLCKAHLEDKYRCKSCSCKISIFLFLICCFKKLINPHA